MALDDHSVFKSSGWSGWFDKQTRLAASPMDTVKSRSHMEKRENDMLRNLESDRLGCDSDHGSCGWIYAARSR